MSCFAESENCKYELNKSTSSLVDVSLSTPVPPESSAVKKTPAPLSAEVTTYSSSLPAQPKENGNMSLNSSATLDGSFVLNRINDESKDSVGDSQITLSTPTEPSEKIFDDHDNPSPIIMNVDGNNTSNILNQSLMRSVDLNESESKQNSSCDRDPEDGDEECKIFEDGEVSLEETEEEEREAREETEEERIRRENEESERLAWELMQEEQNAAYQAQIDFLNQNVNNFSDEDRAALALVMQESANILRQNSAITDRNNSQGEEDDDEGDGDEDDNDDEQAWAGGEHYERLLELGNVLGDVKTERWRLRSDSVIADLPTVTYKNVEEEHLRCREASTTSSTTATPSTSGSGEKKRKVIRTLDVKCSICMEQYVENDELTLLPACDHYFHVDCAKGWLKDHNSCPICKIEVSATPEK